jgi:ferritin-like metal-binding protein YciE
MRGRALGERAAEHPTISMLTGSEAEFDDLTMDACLIAADQRAEHCEIGAYGTMIAWAEAMGHNEAVALLQAAMAAASTKSRR